MTREECKAILEAGGSVSYHAWTFRERTMGCWDEYNCCGDTFKDVEETLDNIAVYCGDDFTDVKGGQ